jgi:hypothetical protein
LAAIKEISKSGTPTTRISKDYLLVFEGHLYSPKYIISLANKYANGTTLNSSSFSGGREANQFLSRLGFTIITKNTQNLSEKPSTSAKPISKALIPRAAHNERCPECKNAILKMLKYIYGEVYQSYSLEMGTRPEDFTATPSYEPLLRIYQSLQNHRGFSDFVHTRKLPPVDYFIPSTGMIIEFDESQHFTACRKLTLSMYGEHIHPAFNVNRWITLCERISAADNDPIYRDEQRAWYDTLRDFAPHIKGLPSTIRLFSKDHAWCEFNPNDKDAIQRFKLILQGNLTDWNIEIRQDLNPAISRIIITSDWDGDRNRASSLLHAVCDSWPKDTITKLLITCGGFLRFDWPEAITSREVGDNFNPNPQALKELIETASHTIDSVLDHGLTAKLSNLTDYITIGIDSRKDKISTTGNYIGQLHVELVSLIHLKSGVKYWTGKSYPTTNQQSWLVRVIDLESHFIELKDSENIMILGCHDLTLFNNRNFDNTGAIRKDLKIKFRDLVRMKKPTIVLHHPHRTDSTRTWSAAWNEFTKEAPYVELYASAGTYFWENGKKQRSPLPDVLNWTKLGSTIDFIIHSRG